MCDVGVKRMTADGHPSSPAPAARAVAAHYGGGVESRVREALAAAGLTRPRVEPAALAAMDQLHPRGKLATDDQARRGGILPGARVLDLGGGLGGPARWLAERHGAMVTVLDLTPAFCRLCAQLTALCGLGSRVRPVCGDARALPFAAASFDRVWVQYALMNMPDHARLFSDAFRVLAPGGRLVIGDVVAGSGGALRFPVPWGTGPGTTFLDTAEGLRAAIEAAGFGIDHWSDETAATLDWWRSLRPRTPPPALGPQVVFGADAGGKVANLMANLEEGRIGEVLVVAVKPG